MAGNHIAVPHAFERGSKIWWTCRLLRLDINSATATITVSGGTATTDGPMPLWVLAALAAGLIRIASRQLKKAA
jgi:hypothetical protein